MSRDAERVTKVAYELRELYALVQVLKSATTPGGPAEASTALAPLVASIDARLRTALEVVERNDE